MWLRGFKGTKTLSGRRTFRAQDPVFYYDAPTEDNAEEDNELYSKEHDSEAHELHHSEDALFSAWRDEEDPKLRELMQAKERAASTPTQSNSSRKATSPDSVLFPLESPSTVGPPRGGFQDHEDPKDILRPSEDARPALTYSRRLPSTRGHPLSPERHSRFYTNPSRGNRQDSLGGFSAPFFCSFELFL